MEWAWVPMKRASCFLEGVLEEKTLGLSSCDLCSLWEVGVKSVKSRKESPGWKYIQHLC